MARVFGGLVKVKDVQFEYLIIKLDERFFEAHLFNKKSLLRFEAKGKTTKSALSLAKLRASNYLSKQKSNIE